ncbi:MAG: hypothetical protein AAFR31_01765 [Cyanobacteria bacterium J06627_8]
MPTPANVSTSNLLDWGFKGIGVNTLFAVQKTRDSSQRAIADFQIQVPLQVGILET